ncbi:MAG: efflux RND transporter permease subunit [Chlorobi bacterium]|nr:efflux RND transporter permease subunit [Chlorobiota bacterium]
MNIDIKPEERVKREFKLTTLSLKNRTSIFLLTLLLILFGYFSYQTMPKELFPEVSFPYVMVQTIYPGNSPLDMENLVTRPLEKEINTIKGIKVIKSTSSQDASLIFIEFNPNIELKTALQDVKDAVDKTKSDLPSDLPSDPSVNEIDFSEFPIMNINLTGDYSVDELNDFAEVIKDKVEGIYEISKVNIQGINEKEIKVNIDQHKLEAMELNFTDVENAIAFENVAISSGEVNIAGTRRSLRIDGEFKSIDELKNVIVKHEKGNIVYLKDVAEVVEGYEEASSYARLGDNPVVSVQVVKKGGENLLNAVDQINKILANIKTNHVLPDGLHITITNDQSEIVNKQIASLENSMIMSIIFVVLVLFYFLGTRNALFVGLAIPLSMFLSFLILKAIGYRINMIVLFGLILALGMLVDNAIVVVENIYRFVENGYSRFEAAKQAVGEIAVAIIASTATTLAAFVPLMFWDSVVGEFMKYLPVTLLIVLSSSLFVALVIIPVFTAAFIKKSADIKPPRKKTAYLLTLIFTVLGALSMLADYRTMGSLLLIAAVITLLNYFIFYKIGNWFQNIFLVKLENWYMRFLRFALRRLNPVWFMLGTIFLLIFTIVLLGIRKPNVLFFPDTNPKYINILAELPVGTDIAVTDDFVFKLQHKVNKLLVPYQRIVETVLTNVGDGARLRNDRNNATTLNRGLITVTFIDFEKRNGISTSKVMKMLSDSLSYAYPGVQFTFEKNSMGPPTGKPINIEITGEDFDKLIATTDTIQQIIDKADIGGIEGLKLDLNIGKPELLISIDREKARRFGMSTGQIGQAIRTALFGKEVSKYKIGEDEYPIQLRMMNKYRYNIPSLMNIKIKFRNNKGKLMQIPVSAVAGIKYSSTYSSVKRKDLERVITLYSNVVEGYNANNIIKQIKTALKEYNIPEGYEYKFTGEQQDQAESTAFLEKALLIAISLILIILVSQFNSIVKPFIIMASVLFSTIGVFGGIATFKMDIIVIMTGIGIVSLAGVVVNNAIVLIDYIELLKQRKRKELALADGVFLPLAEATDCVVLAGKTRLRPVLLTAITTILGLVPMAIGLNIDFASLLSNFDPKISIGGDMTAMWSPISWTVIFGLSFATFLTLIIVPVMYRITIIIQKKLNDIWKLISNNNNKEVKTETV